MDLTLYRQLSRTSLISVSFLLLSSTISPLYICSIVILCLAVFSYYCLASLFLLIHCFSIYLLSISICRMGTLKRTLYYQLERFKEANGSRGTRYDIELELGELWYLWHSVDTSAPVFLYGTLRAMPLLARALNGRFSEIQHCCTSCQTFRTEMLSLYDCHCSVNKGLMKHDEASVVDDLCCSALRTSLSGKNVVTLRRTLWLWSRWLSSVRRNIWWARTYLWNGELCDTFPVKRWDPDMFIQGRLDD
jgi:hypothetical protein